MGAVIEEVARLTKDMNKLMSAAEDVAEKGDIDGSRFKVELADEIKIKIKEVQRDYTHNLTGYRPEEVCDVCGQRLEAFDPKNPTRYESHFTGVVHLLYLKICEWYKDLSEKRNNRGRSRSRSRSAAGKGPT